MRQHNHNEFQIVLKTLSYFRTHWWVFLIEVAVIFGFSVSKYYRTQNVYQSYASVLIDNKRREYYTAVMGSIQTPTTINSVNMIHLLKSEEVMEQFRIRMLNHYNKTGNPDYLKEFIADGETRSVRHLLQHLRIRNAGAVYNIGCQTSTPEGARDFCSVYIETLQDIYPIVGQRSVISKRKLLREQINEIRQDVVQIELNQIAFEREHAEYMTFRTAQGIQGNLARLRSELLGNEQKLNVNRATKRLVTKLLNSDLSTLQAGVAAFELTTDALSKRLSDLRYREHLTQASSSEDKFSRLQKLKKEINLVSTQLDSVVKERDRIYSKTPITKDRIRGRLGDLELEYHILSLNRKSIEKHVAEVEEKTSSFREQELDYERMNTELVNKKAMLEHLFKMEQATELELAAVRSDIIKLRKPTFSAKRIAPLFPKFMFSGISISLFTILITSVLLVSLLPRIDHESEVYKLNLPVMGKIPSIKGWTGNSESIPPFTMEYLKILNYRILRETRDTKCPIVVVSSPQTGEGKSTITYLLSLSSQSPKRRCLFVDGDLITSTPNNFFGIREGHTPGLKAVVQNPREFTDPESLIMETEHEGISLLPRGGRIESIASPNFLNPVTTVLEKLKDHYDLILVDTPPLFTSSLAHQWCGIGDLIVLVARLYQSRPKDITEALNNCKVFTRAPIGIALNCVPVMGQSRRGLHYAFSKRSSSYYQYTQAHNNNNKVA